MVVPRPKKVAYPAVKLGVLNSRMKDFYDIWMLCHEFDFAGEMLAEAKRRSFENRDTPISADPAVFHPSLAAGQIQNRQWKGFIKKVELADATLAEHKTFRGTWHPLDRSDAP